VTQALTKVQSAHIRNMSAGAHAEGRTILQTAGAPQGSDAGAMICPHSDQNVTE
jgi:hypothetical protein